MTKILPLASQSEENIEAVLDAAFGQGRHTRTAYTIRKGAAWIPALSYAVLDSADRMIGTLQSWPIALHSPEGAAPLIMVGPVAVLPQYQRGGYGRALMDALVRDARAASSAPLIMIGDPEYYGRFWGFSADGTAGWTAPGPVEARRLLALSVDGGILPVTGMLGPRLSVAA